MKNPLSIVTKNPIVMDGLKKAGAFYLEHQSTFLAGGTIGFSLATTAVTMRKSRDIMNTLDDAKVMLAETEDKEKKKEIYEATIKEIAPKLLPILALQAATIACALRSKKITDEKDKRLLEAASALSLAQNAITQYQMFNDKAEEQLGEKKTKKIRQEIAQERIEEQPMTEKNTFNAPMVNEDYLYHDIFGNRYIHSSKSPSDIEKFAMDMSKDLYDGNCEDDRLDVNELYNYICRNASIRSGSDFGWRAEDACGRQVSDIVKVVITPAEMGDHKTLCYDLDIMARPLFRTRY